MSNLLTAEERERLETAHDGGDALVLAGVVRRLEAKIGLLHDRIDELKAEVAEWRHRAIGGTCRILSNPDCNCSLCRRDREVERLQAQLATERAERKGVIDSALVAEIERLHEQLAAEKE